MDKINILFRQIQKIPDFYNINFSNWNSVLDEALNINSKNSDQLLIKYKNYAYACLAYCLINNIPFGNLTNIFRNGDTLKIFICMVHKKHQLNLLNKKIFPGCGQYFGLSDKNKYCYYKYNKNTCSCGSAEYNFKPYDHGFLELKGDFGFSVYSPEPAGYLEIKQIKFI